ITNITYEVTEDNALYVDFMSTTTKKTVVNLTNHSYFNLAGHDTGVQEIYNHIFVINADKITESDSGSIPTGGFISVGGTP
ncbi:galactose-1-epimerase, partial [Klebsiella pneumoniae]|nr:galactose-1-epimerase [Klebsiella pneumoniae]